MKKKLFGNNIYPSCVYCAFSHMQGETQYCSKNRTLKNGKCKKFSYNPIMRTPHGTAALQTFEAEEFRV